MKKAWASWLEIKCCIINTKGIAFLLGQDTEEAGSSMSTGEVTGARRATRPSS